MKTIAATLLLILAAVTGFAQALLTPEEAVRLVLANNYDILIARTSADIAKINNCPGSAGMLPDLGIRAGDNYSLYHAKTDLRDGTSSEYPDYRSNNFSAAAELNWTLFDGGKMFITKKKLAESEAAGELNFRDKVTSTVFSTLSDYYNVVRQKQQLASINEVIRYNTERVKILQAGFNSGLKPKTDLLQAQVDLNVYLENAIVQETVILEAKRELNQVLNRDPDTEFEVSDSIDMSYRPDRQAMLEKLLAQNTQVLVAQKQHDITKLTTRELAAKRLPWLSFSADYNFLQNDFTAGNTAKYNAYGPLFGGTLTLPVYYGHSISRDIKISRFEQKAAQYVLENTQSRVATEFRNAWSSYDQAQRLVALEQTNVGLARENLTISMRRLELGQTTSLEVRQAEESYIQTLTRLIQFQYTAKVSEIKLRQLVAEL